MKELNEKKEEKMKEISIEKINTLPKKILEFSESPTSDLKLLINNASSILEISQARDRLKLKRERKMKNLL